MSTPLKLAVLGDTHLTQERFWPGPAAPPAQAHDRAKYIANLDRTLRPLLADIRAAAPDLVLHSGDLAEGAPGDAAFEEMRWALDALTGELDLPVLLARGNHDRRDAFAALVTPHNQTLVGQSTRDAVFVWEGGRARVAVADSGAVTPADEPALAAALAGDGWTFVLAHSPAFNVARPHFRDRPFADMLLRQAQARPVHALFCGHTHNTSVVGYDTGGRPLPQIMLSAIAWGDAGSVPLAAAKTWLVPPARQRYAWPGLLENSPPVWAWVEVHPDRVAIELRRVGGEVALAFALNREGDIAEQHRAPVAPSAPAEGLPADIVRGWLCLSVYAAPREPVAVRLGEHVLGAFPTTLPHYHHRTPLGADALAVVGAINDIAFDAPGGGSWAVGSVCLELELADGSRRFSRPSPTVAVGEACRDWAEPQVIRVAIGAPPPKLRLVFD